MAREPTVWPPGNGEMAQRIREFDWRATPLGPIDAWPPQLRAAVDLLVGLQFPAALLWGPELTLLPNDAHIPVLGARAPTALGGPAPTVLSDSWAVIGPRVAEVVATGDGMRVPDLVATLDRGDGPRAVNLAVSFSPVHDDAGRTAGVLIAALETGAWVRAEAAQRETDAKLRTLFEGMEEGYVQYALVRDAAGQPADLRILELNRAFRTMTGRDPEASVGHLRSEVIPAPLPDTLDFYAQAAETGRPIRFERFAPGLDRWYDIRVLPRDRDHVVVFFDDITDRKAAEHELRESEARLRHALEIETVGVIFYDETGHVTDVNEAFRRFARLNHPQLATEPLHWRDLTAREWWPAVRALFAALAIGQRAAPHERQFLRRNGERWWGLAAPKRLADGRIVEYVLDVTQRKRTEAALRDSEARYRGLFTSIDEGYGLYEVIRGEAGEPRDIRVLEVNPAYERLMRRPDPAGEVLTALEPSLQHEWVAALGEVAASGEARRFERHNPTLDRWFEVLVSPFDQRDDRIALVFNDITERKREEGRREFLLALSDALRRLTDPREIQATATRMLLGRLDAGWCYYVEWDERGAFGEVLQDATREGLPSLAGRHDVSDVPDFLDFLRSGQTFSVGDFARYELMSPRIRARYGALGFRSMVGAPIVNDGRLVTTLLVGETAQREWSEDAVTLVREVADRTWTAIARARAAEALRASAERQAFLLALSDALRDIGDSDAIQAAAAELLREHLTAGWCYYVEWDEAARVGMVLRDAVRQGLPSLVGVHDVSDVPEFLDLLRSGRALQVDDYATYELLSPRIRARYAPLGFRSMVAAPLVKGGHLKATLLVGDTQPRAWSEGAVALVQEVAERTWAAVERARAEAALRESEEKYRTLFEAMDEGFALCELVRDADGRVVDYRYLDLNPALVRQGGIEPDVLRGRRATEAFPSLDPWLIDVYARVVESGESITVEHYYPHVDRWLRINAFPRGGDRFAVLYNDVSERVHAEEALREREERQAFLLALSDALRAEPDATAIADRALRMMCAHLRLDRGYIVSYRLEDNRADLVHQVGNDAVPPLPAVFDLADYPAAFRATQDRTFVIEDELERQGLSEAERRNSAKLGMRAMVAATLRQGANRPLLSMVAVAGSPRRWTPGEIALVEETAERTWAASERARAEEALRASEAEFRAVANLVPDLLWQSSPDGATDWYNDRWYAYTGQTPAEAAGWGWTDAIHPEDRERSAANYARAAERSEPLTQEHRIRAAGGTYRWFLVRAEPLRDGHGRAVRWFGAATDVHEARVAREELEARVAAATAELRALSRRLLTVQEEERRALARELHDEIGQTLTALGLQLGAGSASGAAWLDESRRIVAGLTNQVRLLSMDLRPAALDAYGLLPALRSRLDRYERQTGVRVDFRHEGVARRFSPPIEIAAYRIVQEALTNVARHAGVNRVEVRLFADDAALIVSVCDEGGGFDPGATSGSGLGGMRERAELLGGTLTVDAAPGKGVTVTVELPIGEPAGVEDQP